MLAAFRVRLYVKVLIPIYIWQHCQDCQTRSLAALPDDLAALRAPSNRPADDWNAKA
jgi:hypothetical protein